MATAQRPIEMATWSGVLPSLKAAPPRCPTALGRSGGRGHRVSSSCGGARSDWRRSAGSSEWSASIDRGQLDQRVQRVALVALGKHPRLLRAWEALRRPPSGRACSGRRARVRGAGLLQGGAGG